MLDSLLPHASADTAHIGTLSCTDAWCSLPHEAVLGADFGVRLADCAARRSSTGTLSRP